MGCKLKITKPAKGMPNSASHPITRGCEPQTADIPYKMI